MGFLVGLTTRQAMITSTSGSKRSLMNTGTVTPQYFRGRRYRSIQYPESCNLGLVLSSAEPRSPAELLPAATIKLHRATKPMTAHIESRHYDYLPGFRPTLTERTEQGVTVKQNPKPKGPST